MAKEVYIILSHTGTLLSETIRFYTKAHYNHTSIALDRELREVYSFGRKKPNNPLIAGFVKEDVNQSLLHNATCCIYKLTVNDENYEALKQSIQTFKVEMDKYKYSLLGLLGVMMNIPVKREYHFFCSQFVATVLQESGTCFFDKDPALIVPSDFHLLSSAEIVFEGCLSEYNLSIC